jgi:hypothetical protein
LPCMELHAGVFHWKVPCDLSEITSVALCLCHASFLKDDGRPIGNAVQAGLSNRPTLLGP